MLSGTRLGVYEVVAAIGEGGIGAVFRPRDTKLDRDVAVKILPEAFAHDADRLARFTREAKTAITTRQPIEKVNLTAESVLEAIADRG